MSGDLLIRPLGMGDLPQYKALRDTMLALHPEAFTSDAASERARPAGSYAPRVGADRPEGGQFTLGAWRADELVGAVSCERELRVKVRHVAHLTGLMVRPQDRGQGIGRMLLVTCIERARAVRGLEMLTLNVTTTNTMASALYAWAGFRRYGTLPRALKVDSAYHDKDLMVLDLNPLRAIAMPSLQEIASCLSGYDPNALTVAHAQEFIARLVPQVHAVEYVPIRSALGRVLAQDVISLIDVPAHNNSAMDGYALRGRDLLVDTPTALEVVGTGLAGDSHVGEVLAGQCLRIMTGAVIPPDLDTVVPQEFVQVGEGKVLIPPGVVKPGDNLRRRGEDLAAGAPALKAGRVLRPSDLGLMASLGQAEVPVRRKLRVAFFSTGDELRSIGEPLDEGCVYDSNRYTLWGMLQRLGVDVLDMGVVRDEPEALELAFRHAAENADAVITSGGVSVGEADHTKQVMARLGDVLFWRIAMRPGRPMAIGRIQSDGHTAILFGLPGNPVAVMVTFYAFVRDALLRMGGATVTPLPMLRAASVKPLRKKPGRTEYQRGIVSRQADGSWQVAITGSQGSGILRSMSEANGLVVLGHDQGSVAAGELVDVLPFDGLL